MDNYNIDEEITESIKKELIKEREEVKLKQTIELINSEILNYIEKRKTISQYILDYRKKLIEDYKDDEDKIVEYFDHERFVKEEAFRTIDRRLKEMLILSTSPYFGKVDFTEEENLEENIYIGRFGMTAEGSYEPTIVDWRAPISALFYSGKLGEMKYTSPSGEVDVNVLAKRQFIIKKAKLIGMFDSALDVKDEILQQVLSSNSSEKLKDIIMTIQQEQDNLIRQPRNKTIVVNGVAGSGKTTIALHRVAYLLYNYRENLENKVLILGPNNIFMEYIASVLPSLGEVGIKQLTFNEFAMNLLKLESVMSFKEYMEKIFSNDEEFIKVIKLKQSEDYIKYIENEINKIETSYYKITDVVLRDKIVIKKQEIEDMINIHYKSMLLFKRTKRARRVIFSRIKDVRDELFRDIEKEYRDLRQQMSESDEASEDNNIEFQRKLKIRELIRDVITLKSSLVSLDNPDIIEIYKDINGSRELIFDDLAPILYLKTRLEGVKLNEEIKHVVIDEAQDYSALQFKVIKEITKCISMTVVGDSNQRLLPIEGSVPMLSLDKYLDKLDIQHYSLEKSYRSTREIMEYANKYLGENKIVPLVRSGAPVVEKEFDNEDEIVTFLKDLIPSLSKKEYESIAIVATDLNVVESLASKLKEVEYIKVMRSEDVVYKGGTVIIPAYYAKGLEFDAVIIVDNGAFAQGQENTNRVKYVMATRALHELYSLSY